MINQKYQNFELSFNMIIFRA